MFTASILTPEGTRIIGCLEEAWLLVTLKPFLLQPQVSFFKAWGQVSSQGTSAPFSIPQTSPGLNSQFQAADKLLP